MSSQIIGIDLGTTNTCVGVIKNDRVIIVQNEQGLRTFPSMVSFTGDGIKVGLAASDVARENLETTVYDIKRIIGSRFSDKQTQREIESLPYEIFNKLENPTVKINDTDYYPEEISALVLKHAKKIAEEFLDEEVARAVVTVPAYFNNSQRQATRDAGRIAGLDVVRIISEPTAAAIAYGHENKSEKERKVLVYDFGGGTFDVSIVKIENSKYTVIATDGDTHLGGKDVDENLVKHCVEQFDSKYRTNIKTNYSAMRRLQSKCTQIKERLSRNTKQKLELPVLHQGNDLNVVITREKLEELNMPIFERTIQIVDSCLTEANVTKDDITDVVLVGGSTRIPRVQKLLVEYFQGKKTLRKTINPDEAVAYGATIQAALISGSHPDIFPSMEITDVTPLSLGVDVIDDTLYVIIKRNAPIPCEVTGKIFTTAFDNQSEALVNVYQGEKRIADENILLGSLTLTNFPKRPKGEVIVFVTFALNCDGVLQVEAEVDGEPELRKCIEIFLTENRLSQDEMTRILSAASY